jgi:hypothetical protein
VNLLVHQSSDVVTSNDRHTAQVERQIERFAKLIELVAGICGAAAFRDDR